MEPWVPRFIETLRPDDDFGHHLHAETGCAKSPKIALPLPGGGLKSSLYDTIITNLGRGIIVGILDPKIPLSMISQRDGQ